MDWPKYSSQIRYNHGNFSRGKGFSALGMEIENIIRFLAVGNIRATRAFISKLLEFFFACYVFGCVP